MAIAQLIETPITPQRRPYQEDGIERARCGEKLGQFRFHLVEQSLLKQQVINGVPGQAKLRKDHESHALGIAFAGELQCASEMEIGICDFAARLAGRDAHEPVTINREEIVQRPSAW
jgi:hypothetical protein